MYYARFALLGLFVAWASASAQPFPSKQVRLITPFPPGGSADVIARITGQRLGEVIEHAKAHPGKLNHPSGGIGTVHHLSGELFNSLAGTDLTHIPYRGGNALLTETLAGRTDVLFEAITLSIGQIQAGKLRPLA